MIVFLRSFTDEIFEKENQIEFKTIFRQKDNISQNILNEIRVGTLTKKMKSF